jgi:O-antigen/teichoic acid export membrane protein
MNPQRGVSQLWTATPWLLPVTGILGAQAAVQASNLVTGLLILRFLGVRDYAIYAIAGTLVGVGAVLANLSLYPATSHQVARAAGDRARLNAIISTAWLLQIALLAVAGLGVSALGLAYRHQLASNWQQLALLLIVLVNVLLAARLELARSVLYALQTARPIVLADSAIAAVRVVVIVPLLLMASAAGALPVLLANALAQLAGFVSLRLPYAQGSKRLDRTVARELLRYMAPVWPENLYYLVQGNVALLVLAWVGTHSQVAELGALTRLAQVVMILGILNRFLVQPYVARYRSQDDFRERTLQVLGVYAAGGMFLLLFAWLLPQPLLMILGSQYAHLTGYVLPAMALAVLSLGATVAYWLCLSSGRPGGLSLTIPFNLAIQVGYISLVGLATVESALGFMLVTATGEFVVRLAVLAWLALRPGAIAP